MEMGLFQLLMFTVFSSGISAGPYQYHLITALESWTDAQAHCRDSYADLATVENDADLALLQKEAQRLGFTAEAWVGLYNDINSWRCSRDEVPLGSWSKWKTDQPNNAHGKDECVTLFQDKRWYDVPCSSKNSFICYDERRSSLDKFVYYADQKTWMEARDYCRQIHTDLACPTNDGEHLLIENKFSSGGPWIGFYRDAWKWSDKTNDSDIKWSSYQPDNAGGKDNCGYVVQSVFGGTSGGWFDDGNCSDPRAFFCQYVPNNKQVMRVVVQSSQDMNDPTEKAAFLGKIQQKLMEKGMAENLTVRWRERTDGTVFHKQNEKRRESVENTTRDCEL